MHKTDLFRNLMILAVADKKLTREEIVFLTMRAAKWGISEEATQRIFAEAQSPHAEIVIPSIEKERRQLLADLLRMMAVDGELAPEERKIFAVVAATMEIDGRELDRLIDGVLGGEEGG